MPHMIKQKGTWVCLQTQQQPNRIFKKISKNEQVCKNILPVHMGPMSNLLSQKMVENLVPLSL